MHDYQLPSFSMDSYAKLLNQLKEAGYRFQTIAQFREHYPGKIAYLRHDVDLDITLIREMALVEQHLGVCATYFIPLTLSFNALYTPNQRILRQLCDMGHQIGLHYDLETYPLDSANARRHLDWEVSVLSKVVGSLIHTICLHNPYKGQPDPFRQIDEYVHPHDPRYQEELLYVSDSCRAWRDESLLTCFGPNPPRRLLLNLHPEVWLDASVVDRIQYLDVVLLSNTLQQRREYLEKVRKVWLSHPATKLHDRRQ